jgi:hypothetical protein
VRGAVQAAERRADRAGIDRGIGAADLDPSVDAHGAAVGERRLRRAAGRPHHRRRRDAGVDRGLLEAGHILRRLVAERLERLLDGVQPGPRVELADPALLAARGDAREARAAGEAEAGRDLLGAAGGHGAATPARRSARARGR